MYLTVVFPMKYIQGPGAIRELPKQIETFGGRAFITPTRSARQAVIEDLKPLLGPDTVIGTFGGECHERELNRLVSEVELTGERAEVVADVYDFCEAVGLPTTLEDIGVIRPSLDELMAVASRACAEPESIHYEALTVTPDKVIAAMLAADALSRSRKC